MAKKAKKGAKSQEPATLTQEQSERKLELLLGAMRSKGQSILELDDEEQLYDFFLNSNQYQGLELPEYIEFDKLLRNVAEVVGERTYEQCVSGEPEKCDNVNLRVTLNKDGAYGVRPLQLSNPVLYYLLVRELVGNWPHVRACFEAFTQPHITSCAMPVVPHDVERFHKATVILNWWRSTEQRSIALSLQFSKMFVTDISNCYGCIDPRVFTDALTIANTEGSDGALLAANIQRLVRAMQHGRNVGIPQGSALYDTLSEIVLGYADFLLAQRLRKEGIEEGYEIIRYRDDYRVYCNDAHLLERISYTLQDVLEQLNFKMNVAKTKVTSQIVVDSIKKDKLAYIYNTPIFNNKSYSFDSYEKHLLFILMFGRQYPNAGQLKNLLHNLSKRIAKRIEPQEEAWYRLFCDPDAENDSETTTIKRIPHIPGGAPDALIAVATQIGLDNVTVANYALRIISQILTTLNDDEDKKKNLVEAVRDRFLALPNSAYVQIWLQNLTYPYDPNDQASKYEHPLCRLVAGQNTTLWNFDWLKPALRNKIKTDCIVNRDLLKKAAPVITFRERRGYDEFCDEAEVEEEGE